MRTIVVPLGGRSYSIFIGSGLLSDSALLAPFVRRRVAVVTNTVVAPLYYNTLQSSLCAAGLDPFAIVLPDGEENKNWTSLNLIFDGLLSQRCERSTPLIALGGGVIGDTTGFAAACYQRGVPFLQVPTSLLSQVDSSVGGKTAINHPLGKNMIGAFHQPKRVLIDIDTLSTLPQRQFSSGLAEVIKYGLIGDRSFFEWLEAHMEEVIARNPIAISEIIARSCQSKADLVVADETEKGERALLNLGHTFGHAIETGSGYGLWLHGEAVAVGIMMAAELSRRLGWIAAPDVIRIETLLLRAGLPVHGPKGIAAERYLELMSHDKKVLDGQLRLILLRAIGKAVVTNEAKQIDIVSSIMERTPDR
jgi:3-dehydroquinate synthase